MASILMAYGLVLAVSGVLLRRLAIETSTAAFSTGLVLGALCLIWGVRAWLGQPRRVEPIVTVIAATVFALIQVVPAWLSNQSDSSARFAALLLTAVFLMTIGMLLYLCHGERPPEFYNQASMRRDHPPR